MPKILIVDDSGLARRIMRSILEPAGYQVIEAANGSAAIELYSSEKPDLVVLDLTMEEMSGYEVFEKLREMNKHAKIVIATADIQKLTREEILAKGASAFLHKPLIDEELVNTVQTVLGSV